MFAHENDFDSIVSQAASAWDVEPTLIKGIIAAESEFNVRAWKDEPQINDASYGLMQILYGTATALGFTGSRDALYDPTTNIRLGTRYLRDNIKTAAARGFGVDSAISAYNGGFSAVRPGDGKRVTNVVGSPFINQAYVDRVLSYAAFYTHGAQQLETVTVIGQPVEHVSLWSLMQFAFPLAFLFLVTRKRHRK